ncbi:thiamine-phosphate pyrophosphorylase [Natronospira proteinivora]|uniref:Thiamine-phosphate synthase n=1 Tax=Natronospira proteinivora TaxID=1807133 RepID=A0ABT1G421_9GAMM|nr:thiamine phosphate synthase [Natronospira proteinivora]MCP1726044.1 thiamine-phosphate pyrophosphorylase [Natronospira proteinivora]
MASPSIPRGIYVLTDHHDADDKRLLADVSAALAGGAAMIQYRDKSSDSRKRRRQAEALQTLCRQHDRPLIINDDLALAEAIAADGLHLGRDDGDLGEARARLGDQAIIGLSCYNELDRARQGAAEGADYLAFGSVFPSDTKPDAVHCPLPLLEMAARELDRPICAIGGIALANAGHVAATGARLAAVIGAVWRGAPKDNVAALDRAFNDAVSASGD